MLWRRLAVAALLIPAFAEDYPENAVRGLLAAFDRHPIVAVAEGHRFEQDKEFLIGVMASREFAAKANDIVIEFGTARFQSVLDDYIAGKHVSPARLGRVWGDTTVVNGLWDAPIYDRFLAAVRERNRSCPKRQRLRVLACDPPINWPRVKTVADAAPWLARDPFCAGVIEREVLAKGRRALVVMGDGHVSRLDLHGRATENAMALVERKHPGSVFAVLTYLGQYRDSTVIEDRLAGRTPPLLIPLAGTWLGALPNVPPKPPTRTRVGGGQVSSETVEIVNPRPLAYSGDAMLYLGPKATLTRSRPTLAQFSAEELRELDRRHRVLLGTSLDVQTVLR